MKNNTIMTELVISTGMWVSKYLNKEVQEEIESTFKNNIINTIITCNYDGIDDGFLAWDKYKWSLINLPGEAVEQLKVIASVYETFHTNIIMNEEIPVDKHFYLCHTFFTSLHSHIVGWDNGCIDLVNNIEIEVTDDDKLVTELLIKNKYYINSGKR